MADSTLAHGTLATMAAHAAATAAGSARASTADTDDDAPVAARPSGAPPAAEAGASSSSAGAPAPRFLRHSTVPEGRATGLWVRTQIAERKARKRPVHHIRALFLGNERRRTLYDFARKVLKLLDEWGIRYCATYGTLGGVHLAHGLFPFDDDIDLLVPDAQLPRLIRLLRSRAAESRNIRYHNGHGWGGLRTAFDATSPQEWPFVEFWTYTMHRRYWESKRAGQRMRYPTIDEIFPADGNERRAFNPSDAGRSHAPLAILVPPDAVTHRLFAIWGHERWPEYIKYCMPHSRDLMKENAASVNRYYHTETGKLLEEDGDAAADAAAPQPKRKRRRYP